MWSDAVGEPMIEGLPLQPSSGASGRSGMQAGLSAGP
jgi:hypothetical protein